VGNRFYGGDDEPAVLAASDRALAAAADRSGDTVVVTNEVGLGIVPADRESRAYRDTLGRVNQAWVGRADRALLLVAGRALPLHDPDDLLG
jgi:adenosylcobinamide kinase/adenosylcobinamide-phosphate guanylyltransferase